jgi:hypothetical protein
MINNQTEQPKPSTTEAKPAPAPRAGTVTGFITLTRGRGDAPPVQGGTTHIVVNSVDISYLMELQQNPFGNCALRMRDGKHIVVVETITAVMALLPMRF